MQSWAVIKLTSNEKEGEEREMCSHFKSVTADVTGLCSGGKGGREGGRRGVREGLLWYRIYGLESLRVCQKLSDSVCVSLGIAHPPSYSHPHPSTHPPPHPLLLPDLLLPPPPPPPHPPPPPNPSSLPTHQDKRKVSRKAGAPRGAQDDGDVVEEEESLFSRKLRKSRAQ